MSRFGDLLGGKTPEVPTPIEVTSSPSVTEDTTAYEEVIEAELAEKAEDEAAAAEAALEEPSAPSGGGGYYVPSATGTSPLSAG